MNVYKITRRAKECGACEKPFEASQRVVSAIYVEEDGFRRSDFHEGCFDNPAEVFSYWVGTLPEAREEGRKLDFGLARDFLGRLLQQADPQRAGLAYALVLLLSRKRRIKIDETRRTKQGEILVVTLPGDEEDETFEVEAPHLDAEEVARIQGELELLFEGALTTDPAQN